MEAGNITNLIFGIVGSGAIIALINRLVPSKDKKLDFVKDAMHQVSLDMKELRENLKRVEADLDGWKDKYYKLLEEHHATLAMLREKSREATSFREENKQLREEIAQLRKQVQDLKQQLNKIQKTT